MHINNLQRWKYKWIFGHEKCSTSLIIRELQIKAYRFKSLLACFIDMR